MTLRPRHLVRALLAATLLAATAGCGIDADEGPRDIDLAARNAGRAERNVQAASTSVVYFVAAAAGGGGASPSLQPIERDVSPTAATVLAALFAGPTQEEVAMGVTTALPASTRLGAITLQGDLLTLDVSAAFLTVGDDLLEEALGQIVLTATDLEGVESVVITVAGEHQPWRIDQGRITNEPLARADFAGLVEASRPTLTSTSVAGDPTAGS